MKNITLLNFSDYYPFIYDGQAMPDNAIVELSFESNPEALESAKDFLREFHLKDFHAAEEIQKYILSTIESHYYYEQIGESRIKILRHKLRSNFQREI